MRRHSTRRLVIGAMTGTSIDGIDLALVEISGRGLDMRAKFLRGRSASLGGLAPRLREAAAQVPRPAAFFAELALELGRVHAEEARALAGGETIDLAVLHGQTIHHAPPVSWQLMNPFPVAAALGCEVMSDLRQADLAAGGQGAPITPLADWILFGGEVPRVILNLGGFSNATVLPAHARRGAKAGSSTDGESGAAAGPHAIDAIRGADLCVCNQLLDRAAAIVLGQPFDRDGAAAQAGRESPSLRAELEQLLDAQRLAGRSLGTGDEAFAWVARAARELASNDLLRTAVAAIGAVIGHGVRALADGSRGRAEVIAAGGGARNLALCRSIAASLGRPLTTTGSLGVPIQMREAAAMAVLGALACDGVPISLRAVTGRSLPRCLDGLRCRPSIASDRGMATTTREDPRLANRI